MAVTVQVQKAANIGLLGDWPGVDLGNEVLGHLRARALLPATVRAYAFDVANLARFLAEHKISLAAVEPMDVSAWVDWQGTRTPATGGEVVRFGPRAAAPRTTPTSPNHWTWPMFRRSCRDCGLTGTERWCWPCY